MRQGQRGGGKLPCGGVGEDMGELQGGSVGQHHLSEILNIKIPVITISNFNVFIFIMSPALQNTNIQVLRKEPSGNIRRSGFDEYLATRKTTYLSAIKAVALIKFNIKER